MTRAVALIALLLTPLAGIGAAETTQKRVQPNVALFLVDDLNASSNSSPVRSTWVNEAQTTRSEP